MVNVLNKNHPKYCELTPQNVEALCCLHFAMASLKMRYDVAVDFGEADEQRDDFITTCRYLEFQMQDQWGFDQDESFFTHIRHFTL